MPDGGYERREMTITENARVVVQRGRDDLEGHPMLRVVARRVRRRGRGRMIRRRPVMNPVHRRGQHAAAHEDEQQHERADGPHDMSVPGHERWDALKKGTFAYAPSVEKVRGARPSVRRRSW